MMKGQLGIVAIVAIFAVLVLVLLSGSLDNILGGGGLNIPGLMAQGEDLREVYQPYLAGAPNAPTACTGAGGTWSWEYGDVGCHGAGGGTNCGTALAFYLSELCRAAGATWTCNGGAYCVN